MELDIDYDPDKDVLNQQKHKVSLALAAHFDWDSAQIREDDRYDYGEYRFEATGYIASRLHVMIFTPRGDTARIISLRRAKKHEERRYAQAQT